MRLYSNHDRKAAITEPLLLFSLKPGFPAGLSLLPRPSIAVSHFTKTRVEIAVLDNSSRTSNRHEPYGRADSAGVSNAKIRVEIAALSNSPCEIAVFGS